MLPALTHHNSRNTTADDAASKKSIGVAAANVIIIYSYVTLMSSWQNRCQKKTFCSTNLYLVCLSEHEKIETQGDPTVLLQFTLDAHTALSFRLNKHHLKKIESSNNVLAFVCLFSFLQNSNKISWCNSWLAKQAGQRGCVNWTFFRPSIVSQFYLIFGTLQLIHMNLSWAKYDITPEINIHLEK